MRRWATILTLALIGFPAWPGEVAAQSETAPEWPEPPVKLLILGTFHFKDAGLDSYRPKHDVDILSPDRQKELTELVRLLATFEPKKIAVERLPARQASLDRRYASYREGALEPSSDEIVQLGFRLAARLGHERVFAVDAKRRFYEPWVDPDEYAKSHEQQDRLDPDLWSLYGRSHRFADKLKTQKTLREYLSYVNEPKQLLRSHGQYLIGNFEVGKGEDYPGVDSKTAWYNRNLKIFANLQRIADLNGDRILLLIGHGHVPILRHAAQASPQFELVEVSEVLGSPRR